MNGRTLSFSVLHLVNSDYEECWSTLTSHVTREWVCCWHVARMETITTALQLFAISTTKRNFNKFALIRPKGFLGQTFLSCQAWMGLNIYEGRKAYQNLVELWDKLKQCHLQSINIGCAVFLNSVGTKCYKNWYNFTVVQQKCHRKLILVT